MAAYVIGRVDNAPSLRDRGCIQLDAFSTRETNASVARWTRAASFWHASDGLHSDGVKPIFDASMSPTASKSARVPAISSFSTLSIATLSPRWLDTMNCRRRMPGRLCA